MDLPTLVGAVVLVAAAYLIGGIPWGIVVARAVGGPDPRSLGSGRTGGANVMRALGLRAALVAGLLDAAKGSVAVLLAIWFGPTRCVQVLARAGGDHRAAARPTSACAAAVASHPPGAPSS